MQPMGDRIDQPIRDNHTWQPPLEADPTDAREQSREVIDDAADPEAPVASSPAINLDLSRASEADLADQLHEIPFDDDLDR
jgi:hypothetical protein